MDLGELAAVVTELTGDHLPEDWSEKILTFHELLCAENKIHNLTRIVDFEDYLIKHVLDSLLVLRCFPELAESHYTILDAGTGGGFPAVPLAITLPQLEIVAVDSRGKKVAALQRMVQKLDLLNVTPLQANLDELQRDPEYRHNFDFVLVRALGKSEKVFRLTANLLMPPGGKLILYKTPHSLASELKELEQRLRQSRKYPLRYRLSEVYQLPQEAGERQFLWGEFSPVTHPREN